MSDSATDKQVLTLETRGKRNVALQHDNGMFGPRRHKKHTHTTDKLILRFRHQCGGGGQHPRRRLHLRRNPTWPRTATRAKDLHLEGRCQHRSWAVAAGVSSRNPARADGSTSRSVASASRPPMTSARLMASAARLRRRSRHWMTWPSSSRCCYASSAWEVTRSWVDEVSSLADSASVHAETAASGSGSSQSGRGFL
jgi:hypothetical protein